jgi:tRNA G37 N-methylase Trm5
MEATVSSEMSVNIYQTTWPYIPEDSKHQTHHKKHGSLKALPSSKVMFSPCIKAG